MRPILTFILLFLFNFSHGQEFSYPSIDLKGKTLSDFVPAGWIILDSAKGDLNKDGRKDAAIILQYKDSVALVKSDEDTVLTQPRILVIIFKNISENSYYLQQQSKSFILNHDDSGMDDPFQELTIDKGILQIKFQLFYNIGSWFVTNASYKFRYQSNEFVLIGADNSSFHRATHDYEEYSYNFLTKKRSLTKGNENKGIKKTTLKSLNIQFLKTLKTFDEPFTWEVEENMYL
jgi:hypothetical protein